MTDVRAMLFVRFALQIGAIELVPEGRMLKSGRVSSYFFNAGLFTDGAVLLRLTELYASYACDMIPFDVVYGPAYKGIPLAVGVAMSLYSRHGLNVGWAHDRKEAKAHGEGGLFVGANMQGKRVLLVDDVMTSGSSCDEAATLIAKSGGTLVGCVIAFDRQECAQGGSHSAVCEFAVKHSVPVNPIAQCEDLIAVLETDGTYPEVLRKILEYRDQYGA